VLARFFLSSEQGKKLKSKSYCSGKKRNPLTGAIGQTLKAPMCKSRKKKKEDGTVMPQKTDERQGLKKCSSQGERTLFKERNFKEKKNPTWQELNRKVR